MVTLAELKGLEYAEGVGQIERVGSTVRLCNQTTTATQYSNAQIDDYHASMQFRWQPPLRLTVCARFSHPTGQLSGTAGFGLWNAPMMAGQQLRLTLPRAIWFFYSSPPSAMQLAHHVPGCGWKAATFDALRWPFFALLPTAPLAIPLMNWPFLYERCWPIGQRAIHVNEAILPVSMTAWHSYTLYWFERTAHFLVDNRPVLHCNTPPRGPLGLVIWLDNQYAVVTPWGQFGGGLLSTPHQQWLDINHVEIEPLG